MTTPVDESAIIATLRAPALAGSVLVSDAQGTRWEQPPPAPTAADLLARLQRARSSLGMAHLPAASVLESDGHWYATANGYLTWCSPCPLRAVRGLLEAVATVASTWPRATLQERQHTERRLSDLAAAYHAAGGDIYQEAP